MCSAGLASLGGQAAGVGASTVGAFMGAEAQRASLRSQASIAEINASISDAAARSALAASEREQQQIMLRGDQVKSAQTAAYAANGIDIASKSAVNVASSTDYITQVDANTARANGIAAAWGQRIQADNFRGQATMERAQARGISPFLSGASTLITGAGQVASSWYKMKSTGMFSNGPSNTDIVNTSTDMAERGISDLIKTNGW